MLADLLPRPGAPAQDGEPPIPFFWAILAVAFAARVAVGLASGQALHPDEIFQYLEPAHGAVFGSQLVSWEFIYGARSHLIPGFVAGILHATDAVGLGEPAYYIPAVKIAFCALSLLLPISMHRIGSAMYGAGAGGVAFLLGCFWYEFVGFAHKPLPGLVSCYLAYAGFALALDPRKGARTAAATALLIALAFGVRYQLALLLAPLSLILFAWFDNRQRTAFAAAGILGLALVGVLDHLAWGGFYHSLTLNYEINVKSDSKWEYRPPPHSYILWFGVATLGLFWAATVHAALQIRRHLLFAALLAILLLALLVPAHKEYRFVFPWIPLWLLISADAANRIRRSRLCARFRPAAAASLACAPFAAVSILGISNALPGQHLLYNPNFKKTPEQTYRFFQDDPSFNLYLRLGKEDNLGAVLELSRKWFYTGGYYYLHKPVPLYHPHTLKIAYDQIGSEQPAGKLLTHVIASPDAAPDDEGFRHIKDGKDYSLWKTKADPSVQVQQLASLRFSPTEWFEPLMAKYLRSGRSRFDPAIKKSGK